MCIYIVYGLVATRFESAQLCRSILYVNKISWSSYVSHLFL